MINPSDYKLEDKAFSRICEFHKVTLQDVLFLMLNKGPQLTGVKKE